MAVTTTLKNKLVALTANNTVGLGTDGKAIKGVIVAVEEAGNLSAFELGHQGISNEGTYLLDPATVTAATDLDSSLTYVASVQWHVTQEEVAISSTASKQPVAGDFVTVDGTGGVSKVATAGAFTNAMCDSVNTTSKTATITIL